MIGQHDANIINNYYTCKLILPSDISYIKISRFILLLIAFKLINEHCNDLIPRILLFKKNDND